jgi:hypothetical protein
MNLPFTLPFTLPAWLPDWAFLLAILPVLLYALVFLVMPFSVFGVKSRLEAIEAQLDSLHEEMRYLANKSPSPTAKMLADDQDFDTFPHFGRLKSARQAAQAATQQQPPPIPPAPLTPTPEPRLAPRLPQRPARRTEPRLD